MLIAVNTNTARWTCCACSVRSKLTLSNTVFLKKKKNRNTPNTQSSTDSLSSCVKKKLPIGWKTFTSPHHNPNLRAYVNPLLSSPSLFFLSKSCLTKGSRACEDSPGSQSSAEKQNLIFTQTTGSSTPRQRQCVCVCLSANAVIATDGWTHTQTVEFCEAQTSCDLQESLVLIYT